MKKQIVIMASLMVLLNTIGCASQKSLSATNKVETEEVTVLDKGVKRTIHIPKVNTTKNAVYSAKQLSANNGILVSFKKVDANTISDFETKYQVKLKTKMAIGYYIFENVSKDSDVALIADVMKDTSNIQSLKPNWKMHNTIR